MYINEVPKDPFTVASEKKMYQEWARSKDEETYISIEELKNNQKKMLIAIIQNELPDKQRDYLYSYFYSEMKVKDIAKRYGVHKTCVSHELHNAMRTVRRYAKYISWDLYKIVAENGAPTNYRFQRNRKGKLG